MFGIAVRAQAGTDWTAPGRLGSIPRFDSPFSAKINGGSLLTLSCDFASHNEWSINWLEMAFITAHLNAEIILGRVTMNEVLLT